MNRDDIIRMREQADDWTVQHLQCVGEYHPDFHTVSDERFASVVAAALRDEMWKKAMKLVAEAVAAEREACAQTSLMYAANWKLVIGLKGKWNVNAGCEIAKAIRARGQA
jgi:hypothetical protein